jgi:hypothetical protein
MDRGDMDRGDMDRGDMDRGDMDRGDTDRGDTDKDGDAIQTAAFLERCCDGTIMYFSPPPPAARPRARELTAAHGHDSPLAL